jgi:predicted RNase H-like HicB family nuclease
LRAAGNQIGYPVGVKFEVEVYRNETGEWVATAVEYGVSAKGFSEKEALARIMDALSAHFKNHPGR